MTDDSLCIFCLIMVSFSWGDIMNEQNNNSTSNKAEFTRNKAKTDKPYDKPTPQDKKKKEGT